MKIRSLQQKRKKWIITGVIILIMLLAVINIIILQSKNSDTAGWKFTSVTERTLNNKKLISGQVMPASIESLYVDPSKGKVKDIFVKEGDEVQKGQKLFSYESAELDLQEKQADMDQQITSIRYDQTKNKIKSLKKDIQKAKDANSPETVLKPLEEQLQELETTKKIIEIEMEKNKLQKQQIQKKKNELIVYSSIAGIVLKLDKDAVQSSSGLGTGAKVFIQIASKGPFQVQGTLNELQKAQIQPGQTVTVISKAVPNKTWKGKITEVSEYPTEDKAVEGLTAAIGQDTKTISYYSYKASLESQDGLSPGYHVFLQVNLMSKKMQVIPRSSVIDQGKSSYVYVLDGGKLKRQDVTTGLSDGEWIEVLEGLKPGQKVLANPSDKAYDGMEVKEK
ncbi:efflux RND transporter periplasmic adaptor subunit [Parageobacillus toebii]|uniref:efflux RND transporter periplasmic adaptor subunit n=1 Tax=Parageobacillus toebii TaxID=153151 RepID=UPI0035C66937